MVHDSNNNQIKSKFLEGLNFELRTLLNGFAGPVQLLKFNLDDPELVEIFRMFDSTISKLERLAVRSSIIQNVSTQPLASAPTEDINLPDMVKYCLMDLQTLADLENIKFNIQNGDQPLTIKGNHNLLQQAFGVLLEIAISLSTTDTTIELNFLSNNQNISCIIASPTAHFPNEFSIPVDSASANQVSWDLLLAMKIINQHNGSISLDKATTNSFTVNFSDISA